MIYDPERTRGVIDRLVLLANNLRPATVTISAVNLGLLFGILGALVFDWAWFIAALIGVLVGLGLGYFQAGALSALLEWMAQVLISLQPRE